MKGMTNIFNSSNEKNNMKVSDIINDGLYIPIDTEDTIVYTDRSVIASNIDLGSESSGGGGGGESGVWSISPYTLNVGRIYSASFGTPNNSIITGGTTGMEGNGDILSSTEIFNGTAWATGTNMNTARSSHGAVSINMNGMNLGVVVAGLGAGNTPIQDMEMYMGGVWESGPPMTQSLQFSVTSVGMMSEDAPTILAISGETCLIFSNGWETGPTLNNNLIYSKAVGVPYVKVIGGVNMDTGPSNIVESFGQEGWTVDGVTLISPVGGHSAVGSDTADDIFVIGGIGLDQTVGNLTQTYDGTLWSAGPSLNGYRVFGDATGNSNNSITMGGIDMTAGEDPLVNMETYTNGGVSPTISKSVIPIEGSKNIWNLGNNINTARGNMATVGSGNDILIVGGFLGNIKTPESPTPIPTYTNTTELYNAITWNIDSNINIARGSHTGVGTIDNAMIVAGVYSKDMIETNSIEKKEGNIWSSYGEFPAAISGHSMIGDIEECMVIGGFTFFPGVLNSTKHGYFSEGEGIWTIGNDMNSIRWYFTSVGTTINTLSIDGYTGSVGLNSTEIYNGTTWANSINTNMTRIGPAAIGTPNNSLITGGNGSANTTEIFNGTTWSNSVNMNSNRYYHTAVGAINDCIIMGALNGSANNTTETFNGTTWNSSVNMNINRRYHTATGNNSNDCIVMGGRTSTSSSSTSNTTEIFNGSTWTNNVNMNTARYIHSAAGMTNDCIVMGGGNNTTEIFNSFTWINSSNLNTSRNFHNSTGITTNCMIMGGSLISTEILIPKKEFVWSEDANLNTARQSAASIGTINDIFIVGGYSNRNLNSTEKYNGTAWSTDQNMLTEASGLSITGTTSSATTVSENNISEYYDGTTWSTNTNTNISRRNQGYLASNSMIIGGNYLSSTEYMQIVSPNAKEVWTSGRDTNSSRERHSVLKDSKADVSSVVGNNITILNTVEKFNGITWENKSNTNIFRHDTAGLGDNIGKILTGGGTTQLALDKVETATIDTWSIDDNLLDTRKSHSIIGTYNQPMIINGINNTNATLYTTSSRIVNTVDIVWEVDKVLNIARGDHATIGKDNDVIIIGGSGIDGDLNTTENYNGITWSIGADLNTARSAIVAVGDSTDALVTSSNYNIPIEVYNGISWSNAEKDFYSGSGHRAVGTPNEVIVTIDTNIIRREQEEQTVEGWNSIADVNIARSTSTSVGVSNNTIIMGGYTLTPSIAINSTEIYNGTVWTNSTNMNTIKENHSAAGITNDCIVMGGSYFIDSNNTYLNTTEIFNGTTWTNSVNMNNSRYYHSATGIINDCIISGGKINSTYTTSDTTEIFNGTTWANSTNMNTAIEAHCMIGTTNNAMVTCGKYSSGYSSRDYGETFNGTTWTTHDDYINESRSFSSAIGTPTDAIVAGGNYNDSNSGTDTDRVERYNGTTWSYASSMSNIRSTHSSAGTNTNNLIVTSGLVNRTISNSTIQYTKANKIVYVWNTDSVYLNQGRIFHSMVGTPTNSMIMGGYYYDNINASTEKFDGTTWSMDSNLLIGRESHSASKNNIGTLVISGFVGEEYSHINDSIITNNVEKYDNITWSMSTNSLRLRYAHTSNDGNNLTVAGWDNLDVLLTHTEKGNVLSTPITIKPWIVSPNTNIARTDHASTGTKTSAINVGGTFNNIILNYVEGFNGIEWSLKDNNLVARKNHAIGGPINDATVTGGETNNNIFNTSEKYNGATWSIGSIMNNGRKNHGSNSSMIIGGNDNTTILNSVEYITYVEPNPDELRKGKLVIEVPYTRMRNPGIVRANIVLYNDTLEDGKINTDTIKDINEYNKPIWSVSNVTMNTITYGHTTNGNTTIGGMLQSNAGIVNRTEYMGKDYSTVLGNLTDERYYHATAGKDYSLLTTSGMNVYSGTNPFKTYKNSTEVFNTVTWCNTTDRLISNTDGRGFVSGIVNAALAVLYYASTLTNHEAYNSIIWTLTPASSYNRINTVGVGQFNNTIKLTSSYDTVESFNGNIWTTKSAILEGDYGMLTVAGKPDDLLLLNHINNQDTYNLKYNGYVWSTEDRGITSTIFYSSLTGKNDNYHLLGGANGGSSTLNTTILEYKKPLDFYLNNSIFSLYTDKPLMSGYETPINLEDKEIVIRNTDDRINYFESPLYNEYSMIKRIEDGCWFVLQDLPINSNFAATAGKSHNAVTTSTGYESVNTTPNTKTFGYNYYWSTKPDMLVAVSSAAMTGVSNNLLFTGGFTGSAYRNTTYKFNGDSWTASTTTPGTIYNHNIVGHADDCILFNSTSSSTTIYEYNGTSYSTLSAKPSTNVGIRPILFGNRVTTILAGGNTSTTSFKYENNVWSTISKPSITINNAAASGLNSNGMICNRENSFKYNGTTWSIGPDMNLIIYNKGSVNNGGNINSTIVIGGDDIVGNPINTVERLTNASEFSLYDEANFTLSERIEGETHIRINKLSDDSDKIINSAFAWTNSTNMNSNRAYHTAAGVTNDCIVMGGSPSSIGNTTEIYNGTTWTNSNNMNDIRSSHSAAGITNDCIVMGGTSGFYINTTEIYNGITWTNSTNMNSIRYEHSAAGVTTDCIVMGGGYNGVLNSTEIFNGTTWTNSINMNSYRWNHTAAGITNDCIVMGGSINTNGSNSSNISNTTEIYNGTTWTNSTNMNSIRQHHSAAGITNDCIVMGGYSNSNNKWGNTNTTEIYNGTTWSNSINMNSIRINYSAAGITNDCIVMGGNNDSTTNTTENRSKVIGDTIQNKPSVTGQYKEQGYDYTIFIGSPMPGIEVKTSVMKNNLLTKRYAHTGSYTNNGLSKLIIGGMNNFNKTLDTTERQDSKLDIWSTDIRLIIPTARSSTIGDSNNLLLIGGQYNTNIIDNMYRYNGISWSAETGPSIPSYNTTTMGNITDCQTLSFNSTEYYNGTVWSTLNNPNIIRDQAVSTISIGRRYITGGLNKLNIVGTIEMLSQDYISWSITGDMLLKRMSHSGTHHAGIGVISGGIDIHNIYLKELIGGFSMLGNDLIAKRNHSRLYNSNTGGIDINNNITDTVDDSIELYNMNQIYIFTKYPVE